MTEPRTILVTGASRGIGLLTATTLARTGHHVFAGLRDAAGRNADSRRGLSDVASAEGLSLHPIDLDVTDAASVDRAVDTIEERRPIDVLVNNAGVMPVGITEAYTPEQIRACLDVNLIGAARLCRAVLPGMRARRSGLVIHISSTAGRHVAPFFGVYCASKWALEAYAESLHYELAEFGIESIIVEPGPHGTDLVKAPPEPADRSRLDGYGPIADGPRRTVEIFKAMFSSGDRIHDAQNVADRVCALVDMEAPRPIRTTVGLDLGVSRINERVAPLQSELIDTLRPVPTSHSNSPGAVADGTAA